MTYFFIPSKSCIGMRFSMIEMKAFLFILLTNFVFNETEEKIVKVNVYVFISHSPFPSQELR